MPVSQLPSSAGKAGGKLSSGSGVERQAPVLASPEKRLPKQPMGYEQLLKMAQDGTDKGFSTKLQTEVMNDREYRAPSASLSSSQTFARAIPSPLCRALDVRNGEERLTRRRSRTANMSGCRVTWALPVLVGTLDRWSCAAFC